MTHGSKDIKVFFYSVKSYEQLSFEQANKDYHNELIFTDQSLTEKNITLCKGCSIICCFIHDELNADNLRLLCQQGVKLIALRSAGYDHVDLKAAHELGLKVVRVPAYSPHAVAEFAVALVLALNRRIVLSFDKFKHYDFRLDDLVGFDLYKKKVGIIGTGKIGYTFAKIMHGFGCELLGYDVVESAECKKIGLQYVTLAELIKHSDIISLHCALTPQTKYIINHAVINQMKDNVMLINTGRGSLVDTHAILASLKQGRIGYYGFDVYENEKDLFFRDLSHTQKRDLLLSELISHPNVLATGHHAYLTKEALANIADTTFKNIHSFIHGQNGGNEL